MSSSNISERIFFEYVNAQHITMYTVFLLGALVELLTHVKSTFIPPKLDKVCLMIGFSVEAFLFAFHLHSRTPLDTHLHVLLVYAICGCILFCAFEIVWLDQVLFTYGRIASTLLQGVWFCQAGIVLYPPFRSAAFMWDRCNHEQIMTITTMFCWHFIFISIGLLVQLWFISLVFR